MLNWEIILGLIIVVFILFRVPQRIMFAIGYKLFTTQLLGHNGYMYYLKKQRQHSHTTIVEPFLSFGEKEKETESTTLTGTKPRDATRAPCEVHAIPFLADNYTYVIIYDNNKCILVDPAEPYKVEKFIKRHGLNPTHLLTTHHHWDHAGGNFYMREKYPKMQIFGSANEKNIKFDVCVKDRDRFSLSKDIEIEAIMTEGHTTGHVCFLLNFQGRDCVLFSGDALFCAGAGKLFEGTMEQYTTSFQRLKKRVPPAAHICCGHEYSVPNLEFAATVEPNNTVLYRKLNWATTQRERGLPTLPTTFAEELAYNPFLRFDMLHIQEVTRTKNNPVMTIQMLRTVKDKGKNAEDWSGLWGSLTKQ